MFAYYDMDLALRAGRAHGVVDYVAQDAADFGGVGTGDDLWSAHRHVRLGVKQLYPIELAPRQRA